MQAAGYVLVGGRSSRMGRDKALLPHGESTLASHVASRVLEATGNVSLVGDPDRYRHLGYPVIPDRMPGNGPLSGVVGALAACPGDWALVTACDMPNLTVDFLKELLDVASGTEGMVDCVAPRSDRGRVPLCAVYHRRALPLLDSFLNHKFLCMQDALAGLETRTINVLDSKLFANMNTPEDLRKNA
jgi:molybdopterin-guanine dinucleotide biosynthesis protein A